jgi:hypothetical protein
MNSLTTSKVIAYLAIIFVAGGATGAVITSKARERAARPANMEKVCSRIQDRLKAKLCLTDEQLRNLQPVFDQTAQDLEAVRSQAVHDTDRIICRAHRLIAQELNADQKKKLEEFDKERRDWLRRRIKDGEPPKEP